MNFFQGRLQVGHVQKNHIFWTVDLIHFFFQIHIKANVFRHKEVLNIFSLQITQVLEI